MKHLNQTRLVLGVISGAALLHSAYALAQTATSTTGVSPDDIFNGAIQAIHTWKTLGAFAGLVAIINLLVNVTKIPAISDWIDTPDTSNKTKTWIRPVLAILLAGFAGALSSASTGASLMISIAHGLFAGLAAIGLHELYAHATGQRQP